MMNRNIITLVIVSDDHYTILAATLLKSIETNLQKGWLVDVWIVADNVSVTNKQRMMDSIDQSITTITWIAIQDAIPTGFKLPVDLSTYPDNIYMRLFIPYFIPASIEKVLYLDADMVAMTDISKLWQTDISGYTIAAATDPRLQTLDNNWGGIKNYKDFGLDGNAPYFNTGLLLINTRLWKEGNITAQVLDIINRNRRFANYPDQYGMNIALYKKWLPIDGRWNYFVTEKGQESYILHFVERKPIYTTFKNGQDKQDIFNSYMRLTAWNGTRTISEGNRYLKKIKNIVRKLGKKK